MNNTPEILAEILNSDAVAKANPTNIYDHQATRQAIRLFILETDDDAKIENAEYFVEIGRTAWALASKDLELTGNNIIDLHKKRLSKHPRWFKCKNRSYIRDVDEALNGESDMIPLTDDYHMEIRRAAWEVAARGFEPTVENLVGLASEGHKTLVRNPNWFRQQNPNYADDFRQLLGEAPRTPKSKRDHLTENPNVEMRRAIWELASRGLSPTAQNINKLYKQGLIRNSAWFTRKNRSYEGRILEKGHRGSNVITHAAEIIGIEFPKSDM